MAITTRYELESVKVLADSGLDSSLAAISTSGGGFLLAGYTPTIPLGPFTLINDDLNFRSYDSSGNTTGSFTDGPAGSDAALAQLSNGNIVLSYSTGTNTHAFTIRSADGGTTILDSASINGANTDVTAIRSTLLFGDNGGFVVAHEFNWGSERDVTLRYYSNAGAAGASRVVSGSVVFDDYGAKVTQLDNGNVAVALTRENAGETSVVFSVFNRDLSSIVFNDVVLDNTGTVNEDVAIVATSYGFAVFYEERSTSGFSGTNSIVMAAVSSTGTILGRKIVVTSSGFGRFDFNEIDVTRMENGLLALSYVESGGLVLVGSPPNNDMVVRLVAEAHTDSFVSPGLTVRGGADAADTAERTTLARFGANQLAALYVNPDDANVNGEHLRVVMAQVGDDADDTFAVTADLDRFRGGNGSDTVDLSGAGAAVNVDLEANTASGGTAEGDTFDSIENLIGTANGDTLVGNVGANAIEGRDGDDLIDGRDGDDSLAGGAGDDELLAGKGADQVAGDDGNDSLVGSDGNDSLGGGAGNDTLLGDADDDSMTGGDGDDSMDGGADDDLATGDGGNDLLIGGEGDDTLDGGTENDRLLGDAGEDLLIGGLGNDTMNGGNDNDRLRGGGGDDVMRGAQGNDTISGGGGGDRMLGGAGNDNLSGRGGNDRLVGHAGNDLLIGGLGNDTLNGAAGQDTLRGLGGNDRLLGGGQNDRLEGRGGNDRLDGGQANDTMSGGAGADVFVFGRHAGTDRITDFAGGVDRIDLVGGTVVSDLVFTDIGNDLRITIRGKAGFELILAGVDFADISGSDFF